VLAYTPEHFSIPPNFKFLEITLCDCLVFDVLRHMHAPVNMLVRDIPHFFEFLRNTVLNKKANLNYVVFTPISHIF